MKIKCALIILTLLSCRTKLEIKFFAIKGNEIIELNNSLTIEEFKEETIELICSGYRIVGQTENPTNNKRESFQYYATCNNKIESHGATQLPIYECNGFRKYGLNLCTENDLILKVLREFYLNPKRRPDYPSKPKNAIINIISDKNDSIKEMEQIFVKLQYIIEEIKENEINDIPIKFTLNTLQQDSFLFSKPTIELNNRTAKNNAR